MTVQLSQQDFNRTISIVQNLVQFGSSGDRGDLVRTAFSEVDSKTRAIILARLDFEGSSMAVAVEVVMFFSRFGKTSDNTESLGIFLDYIQPLTEDTEDKTFIDTLFQKYPLGVRE